MMTMSTFRANTAAIRDGGALAIGPKVEFQLNNSTFQNNNGYRKGGAILISESRGTVRDSSFSGNTAVRPITQCDMGRV